MPMKHDDVRGPVRPAAAPFDSTQWSMVLAARQDSEKGRVALAKLCRAYWPPLYGYLRRRGHPPHEAEDLVQGFFAYIIDSDFLTRPDPEKGRFRGYLVGALKHWLGSHFERLGAQKRGGGAQIVEWTPDEAERSFALVDQPELDPAAAYEKSWALTLLSRALDRLGAEQADAGRGAQFARLKRFLHHSPTRGDYGEAAAALGTTRTNIALWVHRLNQRYAEIVRLEVAATVADPTEVKHEMRHLLQALRR
jgi:DNA-directed RNA polymerase specialized sigma24 family protein